MDGVSDLRCDCAKIYASESISDSAKTRLILRELIDELSNEGDHSKKGLQFKVVVGSVNLEIKRPVKWHITEVERLPAKQVIFPSKVLAGGSLIEISGIAASQADVEISFKITDFEKAEERETSWTNPELLCKQKGASVKGALGPFGSSLDNHSEKTTYGAFSDVDPLHGKLSLRSLIDLSTVESFAGGGNAGFKARVYPTVAIDNAAHFMHSIMELRR
ncbi:hypothetical protein Pint_28932 [Pistacia integerrima]|uniref:Uncharacterized protein n=1 Tax=Pistacia integerrima TaxID=434235 RepID=A0ACC0X008_9ROSI|nr:hypothetical protein Pint_28932 [Pistacia integerrima]